MPGYLIPENQNMKCLAYIGIGIPADASEQHADKLKLFCIYSIHGNSHLINLTIMYMVKYNKIPGTKGPLDSLRYYAEVAEHESYCGCIITYPVMQISCWKEYAT